MAEMGPGDMEGWRATLMGLGGAVVSAVIGRLAWHTSQVRKGCRRFWSIELLWEMPLAVFMGLVGGGISEYFGLGFLGACAVASFAGWLGPRGLEALLLRWVERQSGGKQP